MRPHLRNLPKVALWVGAWTIVTFIFPVDGQAQANAHERAFPQSKTAIEKVLKGMQPNLAGRLPLLDGFAAAGEHPLDSYVRGYFQADVEVRPKDSGGSVVRVRAKITAWYVDPATSHSGYQLLESNGRVETDVLDQLAEQLAQDSRMGEASVAPVVSVQAATQRPVSSEPSVRPATQTPVSSESSVRRTTQTPVSSESSVRPATQTPVSSESSVSAPAPQSPATEHRFPLSLSPALGSREPAGEHPDPPNADQANRTVQAEIAALEEVLKQQAHPKNLVAVKKSGTPVVGTRSLTAKTEFLASAHDEFELLGFDADWVHVRISGLSRGWIWRDSVEMPDGIPATKSSAAPAQGSAPDLFHVAREETAQFPGDWEPLRNQSVKIITVGRVDENPTPGGQQARLEYAKSLFQGNYEELEKKRQQLAGIVVIFDSADGGMIGVTISTLEQWRAGSLSDSAFWRKCFFDPPETFDSNQPSGSR